MEFNEKLQELRKGLICALIAFTVFMVAGRLWSGVHWFTDIIGGALLSSGLVMLYNTVVSKKQKAASDSGNISNYFNSWRFYVCLKKKYKMIGEGGCLWFYILAEQETVSLQQK